MQEETIILYRPVEPKEMELVAASEYRRWPQRLPEQPLFYPVTNEEYARQITIIWNVHASGIRYVTKFQVKKNFIEKYPIQKVGSEIHTEWWFPAEDLEELNDNSVGQIEVIGEHK